MTGAELKRTVLPSLLVGTARQPLPGEVQPLPALSLAGQALRFTAPDAPESFAVEAPIEDRRRVLPDVLRRPMLRLLAGKTATEHPAMAVARMMDERHLRPHPFDLPKLDAFVRAHAERLGATALQWAHRADAAEPVSFHESDVLEDANWTQANLGKRVAYLAQRRRQDAAAARTLLEAAWPQESAEARFRLLQAMQPELNAEDVAFLEQLEKDRAPRVRALAQRMLARFGVGRENAAVTALMGRIKPNQAGLLRKRLTLALELPANVNEQTAPGWIREAFAEMSLEEVARALAMSELEMVEAAREDANLLLGLAMMATAEGRLDVLESVVKHLPNAWELLSDSGLKDPGLTPREKRVAWADILVRAYGRKLPWSYSAWSWLYTMLDGPAPLSLLDAAFHSDWFDQEPTTAKHTAQWMELTAALCPPRQREELRRKLVGFDAALTVTAMMLLDFLDALEREKRDA